MIYFVKKDIFVAYLSFLLIKIGIFKNCSRATKRNLVDRMWPAFRALPRSKSDYLFTSNQFLRDDVIYGRFFIPYNFGTDSSTSRWRHLRDDCRFVMMSLQDWKQRFSMIERLRFFQKKVQYVWRLIKGLRRAGTKIMHRSLTVSLRYFLNSFKLWFCRRLKSGVQLPCLYPIVASGRKKEI